MGKFGKMIEDWFDKRFTEKIIGILKGDEILGSVFNRELSAIYRIPFLSSKDHEILSAGGEPISIHQNFLDLCFLGSRLYLVDTNPGAQYGKELGLFIFRGLETEPVHTLITHDPISLDNIEIPILNPEFARDHSVFNTPSFRKPEIPEFIEATLPPLAGPFPPDDLPNPVPNSGYPASPTGVTPPGGGVLLFYGLCFQYSNLGSSVFNWGGYEQMDSLWDETQHMEQAFSRRGYRTATGCAGRHDPTKTTQAISYSEMITGFETDLNNQANYCKSKEDQLVIFMAAHGYNNQYEHNQTGDVALKYDSKSLIEWITYSQFFSSLAKIPKITSDPSKVILIIESCRSGRVFEGGVIPKELKGINILSATSGSDKLTPAGGFTGGIRQSLTKGANNWEDLINRLKWEFTNGPLHGKDWGIPGNGSISGCYITITLQTITYQGDNIGTDWEFRGKIGALSSSLIGTIPVTLVNNREFSYPEHQLPGFTSEKHNEILHEGFWGPCSPKNIVEFQYEFEAVEHDISSGSWIDRDDVGKESGKFTKACDGTTIQERYTVKVTEGNRTAEIHFDFEFRSECLL